MIPRERFAWTEEWHFRKDRKYLVGVIALHELKVNSWWWENNTSLILAAEPIIEEIATRKLKKKSLKLAGVF